MLRDCVRSSHVPQFFTWLACTWRFYTLLHAFLFIAHLGCISLFLSRLQKSLANLKSIDQPGNLGNPGSNQEYIVKLKDHKKKVRWCLRLQLSLVLELTILYSLISSERNSVLFSRLCQSLQFTNSWIITLITTNIRCMLRVRVI